MNIFETIQLKDGSKCEILEIMPKHFWWANFKRASKLPIEFDVEPFVMAEVCLIDGKKTTVEYLGEIDFQDYLRLKNIIEAMISPTPLI